MSITEKLRGISTVKRSIAAVAIVVASVGGSATLSAMPASAAGQSFYKYSWSSQLYTVYAGKASCTTLAQYKAAGAPAPVTVGLIAGSRVIRYHTTPAELFLTPVPCTNGNEGNHKLTPAQWTATGHEAPVTVDYGYYKNSHSDDNVFVRHQCSDGDPGGHVDLADYILAGTPTPQYGQVPSCF